MIFTGSTPLRNPMPVRPVNYNVWSKEDSPSINENWLREYLTELYKQTSQSLVPHRSHAKMPRKLFNVNVKLLLISSERL